MTQFINLLNQDPNSRGCFTVGAGIDPITSQTCADIGNWIGNGKKLDRFVIRFFEKLSGFQIRKLFWKF